MRIIGGLYRHRLIDFPKSEKTRPTKDMVRQGIFNVISNEIYGKTVLDLFSGSGAMGIEALSRGASRATLVDRDGEAISCIKKNLASLNIHEAEVVYSEAKKALSNFVAQKKIFDIIFLDPPYSDEESLDLIREMETRDLVAAHGIIIYEGKSPLNPDPTLFSRMKTYRYGITVVTVLWR